MQHLMTWFGTVVCHNPRTGQLLHRPLAALCDDDRPVLVERCGSFEDDRVVLRPARHCATVRPATQREDEALSYVQVRQADGAFCLKVADQFLSARAGGTEMAMMPAADSWETFRFISKADLEFLIFFQRNDWWRRSSRTFVRAHEIKVLGNFKLKVGSDELSIPRDLPSAHESRGMPDGGHCNFEVVLFFDGWRIEEFQLFRPLVFAVAYGPDEIFRRLHLSLRSLLELGQYPGDILVIGDKSHRELAAHLPGLPMDRIHVYNLRSTGTIDYYSARYYMPNWESAHLYQPFLYMDIDVAVDRPIMPLFEAVAFHDKMSFQAETWTRLDKHGPAGSALVNADPGIRVGDLSGFNSGIFSIPSLKPHEGTLRQIRETIRRYLDLYGFEALTHFDQAIANYVTVKLAPIDYEFLTSRVRYTRKTIMNGGSEPLGFVHFWGNGRELTGVMKRFIEETPREVVGTSV